MSPALSAYLARIGLAAPVPASAEGLATLQRAQRQAIGFENLDVMLGRGIAIEPDAIAAKLVARRRGGYCFEQNPLFGAMLDEMGLPNRPLLGRVWLRAAPGTVPPRTHTFRLVTIDDTEWIGDAGFGSAWVPPLPLADGAAASTPDGFHHRLRRADRPGSVHGEWLVERRRDTTDWEAQYSFDTAAVDDADLAMSNHWTSTRPQTRFTVACIVSIVLPDGFAAMVDRDLTVQRGDHRETSTLATPAAWQAELATRFAIDLDDAGVAALTPHLFG